jgi:DNA-binding LytR/AlgR family response regulator
MTNNTTIKCVVVDDEPLAVKLLADYISKTPGLEIVFQTMHVLDALQFVQEGKADLIFLDIQMPELSGIQFMKIIRNNYKVILTTAYHEYALESYEHDVVDYLLKPITFERFMIAVQKARQRLGEKTASSSEDHIFIKTEYRIQRLDLSAILYVEALRDYIAFHLAEGKVLSLETMRNMETILPANRFVRIHKSYIINKDKINFLERGKVVINNQYLPIGDTYREKLTAQLKII